MKQKITIEIENDTGVEFEEVAECRKLRMGEYYVDIDGKVQRSDYTIVGCKCIVLTPKVDKELEEAKRKFPVGSWFRNKYCDYYARKVDEVERSDSHGGDIVIWSNSSWEDANSCTPFPIPVWRCCESDKPKKEGYYPTRRKEAHGDYRLFKYSLGIWTGDYSDLTCFEWLDEGGE